MTNTSSYWLGIDCGGTYLKAGLYDQDAHELGIERHTLTTLTSSAGYAERDMTALWEHCANTIQQLLSRHNIDVAQIKGIGISAQGKGLFLLDKNDRPLGHAILSSDRRATNIVREWQQQQIPQQLYPLTRQTLWTGHPATLLRWLKQHEPSRYQEIGSLMMAHDFLRWKFTGVKACELSNISESNLYNLHQGNYDPYLTQLLGISEIDCCLPPIIGSTEISGYVTDAAAKATGLLAGIPVVGGLFDVVSTAICAGLHDEQALNVVMGTWAVTTGISPELRDHEQHCYVYGHYAEKGQYIVHEASPTSSANLEWIMAQLKIVDFEEMNAQVASLPPASSEVFFLPFLYGSNAGLEMNAGFYGLQAHHTQAHLLQAVYEGVVFSHMTHINRMLERFTKVKALRVTGGPTRSTVWMQMLADISGLPLELPQVEETGCFGAALCAMVGTQRFTTIRSAQQEIHLPLKVITPNPALQQKYQQKFRHYQLLTKALQAYHRQIEEDRL